MLKHKIVTMKLSNLAPAPYNPRRIGSKELKGLEESLKKFGMVEPVVWNKKTKRLVGGHQRVRALKAIGEVDTPVVVVNFNEIEEKTLNATLNNPEIQGEFTEDMKRIASEIERAMPAVYRNLRLNELAEKEKKTRSRDGEVTFTEELLESHNYVVLYFDNEIDWNHLLTIFPLKSVKALDSKPGFQKIGVGRVVKGIDFIKSLTKG